MYRLKLTPFRDEVQPFFVAADVALSVLFVRLQPNAQTEILA